MEVVIGKEADLYLKELDRILEKEAINIVYQPIVSIIQCEIIGYEALARGPEGSVLQYPDKLFETARKYNKTWELESLCRIKAIQGANIIPENKFLFINVDPHIFRDENFKRGVTKEFIEKNNMSCEHIIFEITEKTSIGDYANFKKALENYTDQGFKIAIDDTGAGYSGLKTITETKPNYVKIDMDIIRDIDKDTFKQALIEAFVKLSISTSMKLIAEGIETEAELLTLINLGVCHGQGYFLGRPDRKFQELNDKVKEKIEKYNKLKNNRIIRVEDYYIGEIARLDKSFDLNTKSIEIKKIFDESDLRGICIVDGEYPKGLVMKHTLYGTFSTLYGNAIFTKVPIYELMETKPLIVDYYTPMTQVSKAAMNRETENVYDYIVVTKNNKYYGIVTVKILLHYTTMLESNYARNLNPLSGLPGNLIIDKVLENCVEKGTNHCILYFDLDNFKSYNDNYGFESGDKMLKYTSHLLKYQCQSMFPFNSFIGHIGGDDFIFVVEGNLENCKLLCENIIDEFNKNILNFFNETDKKNKFIESINREGRKVKSEITSLSVAGLYDSFTDIDEIGTSISKIKKLYMFH
ncbi:GGDEF domain-containing protein [Romboutsia sp.]|uniref:GGDEF domain-containing protein n=1 Tax=Romboutsia sp. TaxID=1965302 RepID=UPI003F412CF3